MTNLNSYTIENHLYRIGDEYLFGRDQLKIESIISIIDTVFFFCSKKESKFTIRITTNRTVASDIMPINAMVFHHNIKAILEEQQ
jgi:hypothetical protein